MCGIVGYIGSPDKTVSVLLQGLKSLEYRGYDSSGICVLSEDSLRVVKSEGKLENLESKVGEDTFLAATGIGHTRWATHGKPNENNAHPHCAGPVSLVHNGIIENYSEIKDYLAEKGHSFKSDTDTEILAHLIEHNYKEGVLLENAVIEALSEVEGSYALAVVSEKEPGKIVAVRKFSPLVIAENENEKFIASDIPAILPHSKNIIFLEDGDTAVITDGSLKIIDAKLNIVEREKKQINWDPVMIEKAGFRHYMLKEIHEQPRAILDTIRGRFNEKEYVVEFDELKNLDLSPVSRVLILGCGTSYHAALIGKYMIESVAGISVEIDLSSEFRYRDNVINRSTLVIAITQSGETADTSEALIEAKKQGAITLGLTNVEMSKIARESDFTVYTKAGPEIGVASTKAFTTQIITIYMLAVFLSQSTKATDTIKRKELIQSLISLPKLLQLSLDLDSKIKDLAKEFHGYKNFIYLGRGINYPVALEGSLKLKEISYIHAEGYAAGEMKHGPIALIDENMPVVLIAPKHGNYFQKIMGNFQEIKARGGRIIVVTSDSSFQNQLGKDDRIVLIPDCSELLSPLVTVIPLQFLAYHIANLLGTDVDQPRNLAKVVTVE